MKLLADGGVDAGAVKRVELVVEHAGDGLRSYLPAAWLVPSFLGLQLWQWIALALIGALIFVLTLLLVRITAAVVRRVRRERASAEQIIQRLSGPLKLGWASLLSRLALPLLAFSTDAETVWQRALRLGLLVSIFWGSLRVLTAWSENFGASHFAQARPGSRALVSLFSRVGRIALVFFAVLAGLSELGYSVTSVLAGHTRHFMLALPPEFTESSYTARLVANE